MRIERKAHVVMFDQQIQYGGKAKIAAADWGNL